MTAIHSFNTENTYGFTATYVLPLGKLKTLVSNAQIQENFNSAGIEVRKSLPVSERGYAYRVRADKNEDYETFNANVARQSETISTSFEVSRIDDRDF